MIVIKNIPYWGFGECNAFFSGSLGNLNLLSNKLHIWEYSLCWNPNSWPINQNALYCVQFHLLLFPLWGEISYRFCFFLICRRLHCHAIWTSSWRCVYHGLQLPSVRSTSFLYRFKQFWWQAGLWINCFLSPYSHDLKMACIVWQNKWKVDFPLWKVNGEEHLGYCKKCLAILTKLRNW